MQKKTPIAPAPAIALAGRLGFERGERYARQPRSDCSPALFPCLDSLAHTHRAKRTFIERLAASRARLDVEA